MKENDFILVNGVKMSLSEYRKQKRAKNPTPNKKKTNIVSEIKILSSDINSMVKKVKLIRSLSAYYDNAYRQWGKIGSIIINRKEIRLPFVQYRVKAREVDRTMAKIQELAKKNDRTIFAYFEKLSYLMDDISGCITNLMNGIRKSGVMTLHGNHECINGKDRRLGLNVLMSRTYSAIKDIEAIIKKCNSAELEYSR